MVRGTRAANAVYFPTETEKLTPSAHWTWLVSDPTRHSTWN